MCNGLDHSSLNDVLVVSVIPTSTGLVGGTVRRHIKLE